MFKLSLLLTIALITPACLGRLVNSPNNLAYNFTLSALNTTEPNANKTGAPLVLGQAGAADGESFEVTSTYASYPYDDFPSLALINNTLRAYTADGGWRTNATTVPSGGPLSWYTTGLYFSPAPTIFSAVQTPWDRYALLAVYGISNLWSLCPSEGTRPQTNLVFNVSADDTTPPPSYLGFNPADCYPVLVNIVPIISSS